MMTRDTERGFSLVEVVLALGLLAGVLISIAGLFVFGDRQVKGGRTASAALTVARDILEEMNGWGYRQLADNYGCDPSTTICTVDSATNTYASRWQPELDQQLFKGLATIELRSLASGGSPPPFSTTRSIRVTVRVDWTEGNRQRSVRLSTVRM